jgi:hypothetical protein
VTHGIAKLSAGLVKVSGIYSLRDSSNWKISSENSEIAACSHNSEEQTKPSSLMRMCIDAESFCSFFKKRKGIECDAAHKRMTEW